MLSVAKNEMSILDPTLAKLRNLKELDVSGNLIEVFFAIIFSWKI